MADFARPAQRNGLYLHVDEEFGGFILPFMRELFRQVMKRIDELRPVPA